MADAVIFGTDIQTCPDPDKVGCIHSSGIHSKLSDGCSHMGSGGWCTCSWGPDRTGPAQLLEESVAAKFTVQSVAAPAGASLRPGLIPASKVSSAPRSTGLQLSCKALVKVPNQVYRPCHRMPEFVRWVPLPGPGPISSRRQRQIHICFTHENAKEVFFENV